MIWHYKDYKMKKCPLGSVLWHFFNASLPHDKGLSFFLLLWWFTPNLWHCYRLGWGSFLICQPLLTAQVGRKVKKKHIKVAFAKMPGIVPSASRGDQCPEGSQGRGEEELEAYWNKTLPSVHLSHIDPTSLGNQQTGRANNLDTGQRCITWLEHHFKMPPGAEDFSRFIPSNRCSSFHLL